MNIDVEISTESMIFILGGWGIHSEGELLNYLATLCLIFGETTILLSIMAAAFYILTSKAWGSNFPTSSPKLVIVWFLFPCVLIITVLIGGKWYLLEVLICIPLMTNVGKHLFMFLLVIYLSSLEKCVFKSFANFWIGFLLLLSSCSCYLYTLDMNFIRYWLINMFFSFCGLSSHPLVSALWGTDVLSLMKSNLCILSSVACAFGITSKKSLQLSFFKKFLAAPTADGSSRCRDWNCTTDGTWVTAVIRPDPWLAEPPENSQLTF